MNKMANFRLEDYETVEERHARALEQYPDLRCVMHNHTTANDRAQGMWVVEAQVFLNAEDQALDLPKAVDWAFEIDGVGMSQKTSALETCATSALGRALRWALGGSKGPSREEMEKVARGVAPGAVAVPMPDGFRELITGATSMDELKARWDEAVAGGFHELVKQLVDNRKKVLANG
jgi:hypothetical protein